MFLLPRILFIVCWWARFDTLASWVDWFPLHSLPLFVMCLCYSVLCGAIALIPLGSATHLKSDAKKQTSKFLIISTERWVIATPWIRITLSRIYIKWFSQCEWKGISSNGRAPALHAGGTGIDTRILQPSYMFGKVTTKTFYRQCNFKTTFFNISKTS